MPSTSGKGEVTFRVFAFRSRRSHTARSLGGTPFFPVPGFVSRSIGEVFRAVVICQRPDSVYTELINRPFISESAGQQVRNVTVTCQESPKDRPALPYPAFNVSSTLVHPGSSTANHLCTASHMKNT